MVKPILSQHPSYNVVKGRVAELLSRILWGSEDRGEYKVVFVSRGSEGDVEVVSGLQLKRLERGFMVVDTGFEEKHIPFHRVVAVYKGGRLLWKSPRHGNRYFYRVED